MARSPEAINHDGITTVGTVAEKAVKGGLLGGLLTVGLGVALITGALFIGVPAVAAAITTSSLSGGLVAGGLTLLAGALGVGAIGWGSLGTLIGGAAGALKGASQVSRESGEFRARVEERMQGRENKMARQFNDGEVKGIDEGYAMAVQDMAPRLEAAKQEGREEVVQAIQQQMMQAQAAQAAQQGAEPAGKKHADKLAVTATCKAEAIVQERHNNAAAAHQVT
jgi:hypothetical protein